MRRMGIGILFSLGGLFLQSLTEWVFRHSPIYYVCHILLGTLAALYYAKKKSGPVTENQREVARPAVAGAFSRFEPAATASFRHT